MNSIRNDVIQLIQQKLCENRPTLEWFGHVPTASEKLVVKRALQPEIQGRRGRGRLKRRWIDELYNDLRAADLHCDRAAHRNKWQSHSKKADQLSLWDKRSRISTYFYA